MKKINIYHFLFALLFLASTSCTSDFDELNTDPNKAFQTDPAYLLSYSQNGVGGHRFELWRGNLLHAMLWSNQFITPWTTPFSTNDGWATAYWDRSYERLAGSIEETLRQIDAEGASNAEEKKAITRIWRAFIYHRITDFWGDVPYSEAGKGNSDRIFQPKYDSQEDIYLDMLNELKEAVTVLESNASGNTFGSADLVYGGDHSDWIKFGNSLRLRLAMRLTEVAPSTAQQHVSEVASASLITVNDDNCRLLRLNGDQFDPQVNGSSAPVVAGFNGNYLSQSLVDILKDRNDPRLPVYALPNGGGEYVGYPNGNPTAPLPDLLPANFSLPNPNTVFALDADVMFLSAAEVNFLLAEAVKRGWAAGNAETYYQEGIRQSLDYHGIASTDIDNYLLETEVVYDDSKGLEQIITQKWIGLYSDGWEAYAEVRRTGFPTFEATALNGEIPKRLRYPTTEQTLNTASYTSAVSGMSGGDTEASNVWWDVD